MKVKIMFALDKNKIKIRTDVKDMAECSSWDH